MPWTRLQEKRRREREGQCCHPAGMHYCPAHYNISAGTKLQMLNEILCMRESQKESLEREVERVEKAILSLDSHLRQVQKIAQDYLWLLNIHQQRRQSEVKRQRRHSYTHHPL